MLRRREPNRVADRSERTADDRTDETAASARRTTLLGIAVFLAIGAGLAYGGLHLQNAMPSDADVEPIEATVTDAEYTQRGRGSDRSFAIDVTYEYEVDGEVYTSSNVEAGTEGYTVGNQQGAQTLLEEQWQVGTTVEAMVNPESPETAYLVGYKPGDRLERTLVHCGMVGVGGLMILASVVSLAKKPRRSPYRGE